MGEILQDAGYKNYFLQGSSAGFTGKEEVLREHGDYRIYDYDYARKMGWIPEDYNVWWGFEDRKLFEFARERLTEIGSREEAFNFSMLTVDTHPQDGYVCELCEDKYDTQYANVAACASSQVYDFVQWCKAQDFYKNTTIVISGDHVSMNGGTFDEERKNRRVYTCYINPAVKPEKDEERYYTVFDDFPTTLAALGFEIEGERLGLGTNLFSDRETLCEEVGQSEMTYELSKRQVGFENK
jgi:phosphoglycerol transferase